MRVTKPCFHGKFVSFDINPKTFDHRGLIVRALSPLREAKGETLSIRGAGTTRITNEDKAKAKAGRVKRMVVQEGTNDVG